MGNWTIQYIPDKPLKTGVCLSWLKLDRYHYQYLQRVAKGEGHAY